jgi:hypothetical protein
MSLTYVYCVVRSGRAPSVARRSASMPGGGPVRVLDAGRETYLIVCSVPAREYDEAALAAGLRNLDWVSRRAVAHEAVVEQFLGARAVLPMQLFTLFTGDDRALEHVTADRRRLARVLARIERQLEWGLRLTFDEEKRGKEPGGARRAAVETGLDYLSRKRDLMDVRRRRFAQARAEGNRIYRAMARQATRARRRTSMEQAAPGSRLLLDAAFLVPAGRAGAFKTALRREARQLSASGVQVSLTGPWPPYNFIDPPARARRA